MYVYENRLQRCRVESHFRRSSGGWAVPDIGRCRRSSRCRQGSDGRWQGDRPIGVGGCTGDRKGGRPELPDLPTGDRTQTKNALIGAVKTAVRAVENKSPSEVEGYKTWLAAVAAKVSQASKEGGFVGRGVALLSREEEKALKQLAAVLARGKETTGQQIGAHPMR
jgi:hypothetical protein